MPSDTPRIIGKPIHVWLSSDGSLRAQIFVEEAFDYPIEDVIDAELQMHRFEAFGQSLSDHAQLGESAIFAIKPNGAAIYVKTAVPYEFDRILAKQLGLTDVASNCADELETDGISLDEACKAWMDIYNARVLETLESESNRAKLARTLVKTLPRE